MSTALYRRYRPETFDEVIGQEHVTEPLKAAIDRGRINHAYLFSGPRGCGKTTSARILARCLNCEKGPTPVPCGECPSCRDLANGGPGSLDVVEIDAASHNGVDDARDLRERAIYAPARDRYKVFILDEAHMVTSQGFNALLKIVEEPPPHIKFIFATTEPEKVIGTIRSRTHHYPFRLVPPEALGNYLEELCRREDVQVDKGVLPLVVRAGGGSVRDTLSVLDQLIAGSGPNGVDYATAVALLGYTPDSLLSDIVDAYSAGDGAGVYRAIERVIESGQDPRRFVEDLLERMRDLIVIHAAPEAAHAFLPEVPPDRLERLTLQARGFGQAELSRAADILNQGLTEMSGATSPRLQLELIAARILLPASGRSRDAVLSRVERMERRIGMSASGSGGNVPPQAGGEGPGGAQGVPQIAAAQGGAPQEAAGPRGNGPQGVGPQSGSTSAESASVGAGAQTGRAGAPGQSPGAPSSAPAPDDFDELTAAAAAAESLLNDTPAPASTSSAPASASPANGADRKPAPMQNRPAQTERDHTAQTARAPQDGQRRGASAFGQSSGQPGQAAPSQQRPQAGQERSGGQPPQSHDRRSQSGQAAHSEQNDQPSQSGLGAMHDGPPQSGNQASSSTEQQEQRPAHQPGSAREQFVPNDRSPREPAAQPERSNREQAPTDQPTQPARDSAGESSGAQSPAGSGSSSPSGGYPSSPAGGAAPNDGSAHRGSGGADSEAPESPAAASQSGPAGAGGIGGEIEAIRRAWPSILAAVEKRSRLTRAIIAANAIPQSFSDGVVYLGFNNAGSVQGFQQRDHAAKLATAINDVLGIDARIDIGDVGRIGGNWGGAPGGGTGSPAPQQNQNRGPGTEFRRPSPEEVAAVVGTREVDKPQVDREKFWETGDAPQGPWSADDEEGETGPRPESTDDSARDEPSEVRAGQGGAGAESSNAAAAPAETASSDLRVDSSGAGDVNAAEAETDPVSSAQPASRPEQGASPFGGTDAPSHSEEPSVSQPSSPVDDIVVPDLSDEDFFGPTGGGANPASSVPSPAQEPTPAFDSTARGGESESYGGQSSRDFSDDEPMEYVQPRWEEPVWHDAPQQSAPAGDDADSTSAGSGAVDVGAVVVPPPEDDEGDYLGAYGDSDIDSGGAGIANGAQGNAHPQGSGSGSPTAPAARANGAKPFKSRFAAIAERHGMDTGGYSAGSSGTGSGGFDAPAPTSAAAPVDAQPTGSGRDEDEYDPETDLDITDAPQVGVAVIAKVLGGEIIDERDV
ncbi:DNA polymerase III subunit gamma and tau [Brevibacterium casei]|uniref:DNA-directed DNA polymerase n=1 Tax=Brevibacterium casei CIP 102111 TaxID=1255625 RepID=A0A2H1IZC4_9MICO|nr:DNA polymerase III subunit gamma and tau [Brevibacterium casei]QPR39494.1 DNA polymerase III subunit gamma and tau [Brevibacterium casei]QPR43659.1 DNA polymerase III subunit gamma and tau [Brevibacterium casei]SMX80516.1 DNA polymerase-3 subunit gamma/tau [Brevibacterium casei CIP 102111]